MQLVIGGSADPSWQPELVAGTAAELVTIAAADHSLELEDADWRASMRTRSRSSTGWQPTPNALDRYSQSRLSEFSRSNHAA